MKPALSTRRRKNVWQIIQSHMVGNYVITMITGLSTLKCGNQYLFLCLQNTVRINKLYAMSKLIILLFIIYLVYIVSPEIINDSSK